METKRFLERNKRKLGVAGIAALGMATLVACANTDGDGNEFKLRGTIVTVGDRSVTLSGKTLRVTEQDGDASGWFHTDHNPQVHNNYIDCGWDTGIQTVGHVVTANGVSMKLEAVQPGDKIEIDGRIRDSADRCGKFSHYSERPVYDTMVDLSVQSETIRK